MKKVLFLIENLLIIAVLVAALAVALSIWWKQGAEPIIEREVRYIIENPRDGR